MFDAAVKILVKGAASGMAAKTPPWEAHFHVTALRVVSAPLFTLISAYVHPGRL